MGFPAWDYLEPTRPMKSEVIKDIQRQYVVGDYADTLGVFDRLADARKCLQERGEGFQSYIESITTEKIIIESRNIIQTLR
jgi:cell division septation protein DedD